MKRKTRDDFPGFAPPEDGDAAQYWADGYNECLGDFSAVQIAASAPAVYISRHNLNLLRDCGPCGRTVLLFKAPDNEAKVPLYAIPSGVTQSADVCVNFEQWFDAWKNPHGTPDALEADEHAAQAGWSACLASGAFAELIEALDQILRPYGVADVGMSHAPSALQMEFIGAVNKARAAVAKATGA